MIKSETITYRETINGSPIEFELDSAEIYSNHSIHKGTVTFSGIEYSGEINCDEQGDIISAEFFEYVENEVGGVEQGEEISDVNGTVYSYVVGIDKFFKYIANDLKTQSL